MKLRERFQILKENRRGGFTLVELIVVLMILTILASILIPSLAGYIERAQQQKMIVQTRQAVMAAQTLLDEAFVNGLPRENASIDGLEIDGVPIEDKIIELAELDKDGQITLISTDARGRVSTLTWTVTSAEGVVRQCVYDIESEDGLYKVTSIPNNP